MKLLRVLLINLASLLLFATPAFAHVIVTPHQVGEAVIQDFTISVPNEKDNPVSSVRLLIPNSLSSVVPDATPGWTIDTKSSGSGDSATVTEIDWSNGSIPVGQRAELVFQAQVPAKTTTLAWKAYQTYSDGTVVSWDINPDSLKNLSDEQQDALADKENKGEYSTTTVINDLAKNNTMETATNAAIQTAQIAEIFAGVAVLLSLIGIYICLKRK